jgi:acetate kinase
MRILTVRPGLHTLHCALFVPDRREPAWIGDQPRIDGTESMRDAVIARLERARSACLRDGPGLAPEGVVVRVPHGGTVLDRAALATDALLDALANDAACAPLHIPATCSAARACLNVFAGTPVLLAPETGFFWALPAREQVYALDAHTRTALGLRRFGFHGLMHDAACSAVAPRRARAGRRAPAHVLSVCLDPLPEIAAVRGHQPVMATGGATPLEGIPGETTSGEIDPGIVLALSKQTALGPEQIDAMLTRESGMRGLAGAPVCLGDVLCHPRSPGELLARDVLEYRILLACGAGAAALGGVDAIAFSGVYANAGEALEAPLRNRLATALAVDPTGIDVCYVRDSIDRVMANMAVERLRALMRAVAA